MIELGLLAGDPCAADSWTRDQRVAAYSWSLARRAGAASVWGLTTADLTRWLDDVLVRLDGLREFVYNGFVILGRKR